MGKLINIESCLDPVYIDIDAIIEIKPEIEKLRDYNGILKELKMYTIKTIDGTSYTVIDAKAKKIIKEKGMI